MLTHFTLQVQKAHKRSDEYLNKEDNGGDTFESLNDSIAKRKDTEVKKLFRVNGHRVDFLQNIQNQVCFRNSYFVRMLIQTLLHVCQMILSNVFLRFTMMILHNRALTWC